MYKHIYIYYITCTYIYIYICVCICISYVFNEIQQMRASITGRDGIPRPHQAHLPAENLGGVVVDDRVVYVVKIKW